MNNLIAFMANHQNGNSVESRQGSAIGTLVSAQKTIVVIIGTFDQVCMFSSWKMNHVLGSPRRFWDELGVHNS